MEKIHMWDIISLLGIPYPSSGQSSYYVQCPCCDENPRKKHLNINLKKEVFRCPRCGASGGIFDLYALYTGIPRDEVRKAILARMGVPDDVKQTICGATKLHAQDILNQLRELQVDLRSNPAVFIGGGSLLLRPFLEASPLVAKADFVESPNANALGYEMLGRVQLSHRPA